MPLEERADWPAADRPDGAYLAAALPSIVLPPRHAELAVVASSLATAERVCAALAARGRTGLQAVSLGCDGRPAWRRLATEVGPGRARLWEPPRFLRRWVHCLPPPARGTVLDLACGGGRAAVWLALRGRRVWGVDRDPQALRLAALLAAREGVAPAWWASDLRRPGSLPAARHAAVVMIRYLQRDLVLRLHELVRPAGIAILRTFRDGPHAAGIPRARHRLRRGEWLRLLPAKHWEYLVHTEDFAADGRPAAGVVARRRGWRSTSEA